VIDTSELDRVVRLLGPERVRRDQTVQPTHRRKARRRRFRSG
jgi:hypothetical protein